MMAEYERISAAALDAFVDTNVFVYSQDRSDPQKRKTAMELLQRLSSEGRLVISAQVLQEFACVAVRKLGLKIPEINILIDDLAKLTVCPIDPTTIKNAVAIHFTQGLSFFDSQILATAIRHGCSCLYSEDMADGQTIQGVKIINPF